MCLRLWVPGLFVAEFARVLGYLVIVRGPSSYGPPSPREERQPWLRYQIECNAATANAVQQTLADAQYVNLAPRLCINSRNKCDEDEEMVDTADTLLIIESTDLRATERRQTLGSIIHSRSRGKQLRRSFIKPTKSKATTRLRLPLQSSVSTASLLSSSRPFSPKNLTNRSTLSFC